MSPKPRERPSLFSFLMFLDWDPEEDLTAMNVFKDLFRRFEASDPAFAGIDLKTLRAYNPVGERSIVVTGHAKSVKDVATLCGTVIFGTGIRSEVFPALEMHELRENLQGWSSQGKPKAGKAKK